MDMDDPLYPVWLGHSFIEDDARYFMRPPFCDVDLDAPNPWEIPDWHVATHYNQFCDISNGWKWEFIRRTKGYRSLWLEMQKKRNDLADRTVIYSAEFQVAAQSRYDLPLLGPQFDCRHSEFNFWMSEYGAQAEKPEDETVFPGQLIPALDMDAVIASVVNRNHILVRIDPWSPLGPQFEAVQKQIKLYQEDEHLRECLQLEGPMPSNRATQRLHTSKFPLYLRLLDARDQNSPHKAPWSEIIKQLETEKNINVSKDIDSVRRMHRAAIAVQIYMTGI